MTSAAVCASSSTRLRSCSSQEVSVVGEAAAARGRALFKASSQIFKASLMFDWILLNTSLLDVSNDVSNWCHLQVCCWGLSLLFLLRRAFFSP